MFARLVLTLCFCIATAAGAQAAPFTVTSSQFQDNAPAPLAGTQPTCGGGTSTSPALAWSGAPAATKSYVIILSDVDNWSHAGLAAHWIAYGIPAGVSAIPAGFGSQTPAQYVSGTNLGDQPGFRGYCPPKGDAPHHYVYTVLATDLAPDALAAGLTRDALTVALKGHTLAGSSIVVRYAQAP
jgi:Raf kinase inhibitor-like YbhB/YbcL family protein